jgi:2-succinyl-6-hydroxy-2,4-cyclohexadiene-1-carboxylate synthase
MTPTLALLHGFTGGPWSFDAVIEAMPGPARVLCPPLSGHAGRASLGGVQDFDGEVERLERYLDEHDARPVHLLGYSLGGRLALGLLRRRKARIATATLVGAHPGLSDPEARAERRRLDEAWCARLEQGTLDAFFAAWQEQPLFRTQRGLDPTVVEREYARRRAHDPHGLAAALRAFGLGNMPSALPHLRGIDVPVRLIAGEQDPKFVELSELMQKELPRARLAVCPEAGHNVVLENPRWLALELWSWIGAGAAA